MSRYVSEPENANTPLTSAEAEMLLADGPRALMRSEKDVTHLLGRLPITLRTHRNAISGLSHQLEAARQNQQLGRASTLSPRDAIRFLSANDVDALLAQRLEVHTNPLLATIAALQAQLAELRRQQ